MTADGNFTQTGTGPRRCAAALLLAAALLAGCAPIVVGGAMVGGAMVASDRRSVGIQLEDEAIVRRVEKALVARFGAGNINVNVTSYNRKVLLAGEVIEQEHVAEVGRIAAAAENVRTVVNEVEARPLSSVWNRNNDTAITTKVLTALLQAGDVPSGAVRVTTTRGTVYLLGRVSEAEAAATARAAARVSGVHRVVNVFDILSDSELAELRQPEAEPESPRSPNLR
jgi:osmotically-inducible protein OsmY